MSAEQLTEKLKDAMDKIQIVLDTEIVRALQTSTALHNPHSPPPQLPFDYLERVVIPLVRNGLIAASERGFVFSALYGEAILESSNLLSPLPHSEKFPLEFLSWYILSELKKSFS